MRPELGQMMLDLFPEERQEDRSPEDLCVSWLVETHGCDEGRVRPLVAQLYRQFGDAEAFDRAKALACFYGTHATQRLRACPPSIMGVFDQGIDYHTLWDRCWAARWVPLQEALEVASWRYGQYREPYTGAPEYVWYIDGRGREVKRPYGG